jgi:hypothetical protein
MSLLPSLNNKQIENMQTLSNVQDMQCLTELVSSVRGLVNNISPRPLHVVENFDAFTAVMFHVEVFCFVTP